MALFAQNTVIWTILSLLEKPHPYGGKDYFVKEFQFTIILSIIETLAFRIRINKYELFLTFMFLLRRGQSLILALILRLRLHLAMWAWGLVFINLLWMNLVLEQSVLCAVCGFIRIIWHLLLFCFIASNEGALVEKILHDSVQLEPNKWYERQALSFYQANPRFQLMYLLGLCKSLAWRKKPSLLECYSLKELSPFFLLRKEVRFCPL